MNNRTFILITLLLLGAPLFGREKTDVLVMKNGDRMTCEVKGLNGGVLYVSIDYIDGTTSVQWSKVAHLESNQLFIVKTEDGAVYTGKLNTPETPAGQPVTIQVVETPEHEVELERTQIVKMAETSDRFWQRFNGEISSGIIYSKGNQSTQYNVGSDAAYIRDSILRPKAAVVAGYEPVMPSFQDQISEQDLLKIIAYIKSIGAEGPSQ